MLKKYTISVPFIYVLFGLLTAQNIYSQDYIQFGKSTIKDSLEYQAFNKSIKVNGSAEVKERISVGSRKYLRVLRTSSG